MNHANIVPNLVALSTLEVKDYMRISRRQNKGFMTKYIWHGKLYYNPEEDYEKSKGGRYIKGYEPEKKPTVIVEKIYGLNEKFKG